MNWNPNTPATLGPEWFPITDGSVTLDATSKVVAMSMLQTASQVIGNERVAIGAIPTRGGAYVLEVYDNETAVPANVATLTARPNEDVLTTGWVEDDGSVSNLYAEIDEATIDTTDYIKGNNVVGDYAYRVATGGLSLTGKRILGVRHVIWFATSVAGGPVTMRPELRIAGSIYWGGGTSSSSTSPVQASHLWTYNPNTKKPWTIADVQAFDTTDELEFNANYAAGLWLPYVFQAYMEVVVCDENRIAVGTLSDAGSALTPNAWNEVAMLTPTGGAWTKDGAGRHLYLLRRLSGSLVVPTLSSGEIPNPVTGFSPTLDTTYGYATAMGDGHDSVFGLIQRTTAPAESVDSQSYADTLEALVLSGQDAEMEITATAANYGRIRARVKPNASTADLLVKIKKRSDNSQAGGTVTVTKAAADALPDLGGGWKALDLTVSPVPTLSAVQYYVEFSSTEATSSWSVLVLDTLDQGNGATFGGTTDRALVNGSEADRYDLAVTLSTVPTAPADFDCSVTLQSLIDDGSGCAVPTFEHPHLTWTPTSLAGSFAQYDLERTEDGGTTWVRVAEFTTEATASWDDYEALRGVQSCYRIRVVRSDGATSDWSASCCETPEALGAEWAFTSNDDPSLNVAYTQDGPVTRYEFLDADDREHLEVYGRFGRIALIGTEASGSAFTLAIVVQASDNPTAEGIAVFDPLRALSDADLPYVCVLDPVGNRWFADLIVPEGNANREVNHYVAEIRVVELTQDPTIDTA